MCYRMNQKHYSLLLLFFLFFSFSNIQSQKLLSGKVIDSKTQEALVGAIVKLVKANSIVQIAKGISRFNPQWMRMKYYLPIQGMKPYKCQSVDKTILV